MMFLIYLWLGMPCCCLQYYLRSTRKSRSINAYIAQWVTVSGVIPPVARPPPGCIYLNEPYSNVLGRISPMIHQWWWFIIPLCTLWRLCDCIMAIHGGHREGGEITIVAYFLEHLMSSQWQLSALGRHERGYIPLRESSKRNVLERGYVIYQKVISPDCSFIEQHRQY